MSDLSDLVDAIRAGDASGWVADHAFATDVDRALRAAWDAETHADPLMRIDDLRNSRAAREAHLDSVNKHCGCFGPCPRCCNAIRASVVAPTWEEVVSRHLKPARMSFGAALEHMKRGTRVRLPGWPRGCWVTLNRTKQRIVNHNDRVVNFNDRELLSEDWAFAPQGTP